jgi:hypothetical protein
VRLASAQLSFPATERSGAWGLRGALPEVEGSGEQSRLFITSERSLDDPCECRAVKHEVRRSRRFECGRVHHGLPFPGPLMSPVSMIWPPTHFRDHPPSTVGDAVSVVTVRRLM